MCGRMGGAVIIQGSMDYGPVGTGWITKDRFHTSGRTEGVRSEGGHGGVPVGSRGAGRRLKKEMGQMYVNGMMTTTSSVRTRSRLLCTSWPLCTADAWGLYPPLRQFTMHISLLCGAD